MRPEVEQSAQNFESAEKIQHNCGIVAVTYFSPPSEIFTPLNSLSNIHHRGQEGFGFVKIALDGRVDEYKSHLLIKDALVHEEEFHSFINDEIEDQDISSVLLHARYSTSGKLDAGQPYVLGDLVIAHNGNLTNSRDLYRLIPQEHHQDIESDTHALALAIHYADGENLAEKIVNTLPHAEGSYSLVMIDPETGEMYAASDYMGNRPLEIGKFVEETVNFDSNGFDPNNLELDDLAGENVNTGYIVASEDIAFYEVAEKVRSVQPGELVKISEEGIETVWRDPRTAQARCIFELKYFSHVGSEVFGIKVGQYRKKCGSALADIDADNGFWPDLIVPVRDSATKGAEGYSKRMIELFRHDGRVTTEQLADLSLTDALFRDRYESRRSFIMPKGHRHQVTSSKFKADWQELQGKSVVLVDDSIVRSNTARRNIDLLRSAGAVEVHLRIHSPPVRHPCYMGTDFPTTEELIAHGKTVEEVRCEIGADSLVYLPLEKSVEIGESCSDDPEVGFCTACFSGNYPIHIEPSRMNHKEDLVPAD